MVVAILPGYAPGYAILRPFGTNKESPDFTSGANKR